MALERQEAAIAPAVTVLMSVLNAAAYVDEAITSIREQTWRDLELIVIDDGSEDDTWRIILAHAAQDSRVVPIRNETTLTTSRALNRGLAAARGKYITRQDGDDCSLPERLAQQVAFLESHPDYGVVGTAVEMIDPQGALLSIAFTLTEDAEIRELLLDRMCLCGPTVMWRRECLERAGFYFEEDLSYTEDYDLCLRLVEVTRIANLSTPLYRYRQHAGSVSSRKRYQQMRNKAIALERALARRYDASPPREKARLVARDYLRAAIIGLANQEIAGARESLTRALGHDPHLLQAGQLVEEVVSRCTPDHSPGPAIAFIEAAFDLLLPYNLLLAPIRARLLAQQHMQAAFAAAESGQIQQAREHLRHGIYHNPAWLLNRGVWSIALRGILSRGRKRS